MDARTFYGRIKVLLYGPDGCESVWKGPGERFIPCTLSSTVRFQGGFVIVWEGISYVEEVVVPYAHFVGGGFLLMHDNLLDV